MRIVSTLLATAMVLVVALSATAAEPIRDDKATVTFIEEVRVPAQEEGILTEVLAKDGQEVAKDQLLAKIDQKLVELQRDVAQAEFVVAQKRSQDYISIKYANKAAEVYLRDYNRMVEVNRKLPGTVSKAEVDLAWLRYEQYVLQAEKSEFERQIAVLDMKVAEAKQKAAQEHIIRSSIIARWSGVIDRVVRFEGDWVKPGDPILRMYRIDKVRVRASLKAAEYTPQDVYHQNVIIHVSLPGRPVVSFAGRIEGYSSEVSLNDDFLVWADVENRNVDGFWILRPGMLVTMVIERK